ncbi:50S ribosomal protein L29 [Candidatus Nomurabacteria bacterium]|nr:50S ribosomal protein L29 [Candidatus Nomurabacteria bacterium]
MAKASKKLKEDLKGIKRGELEKKLTALKEEVRVTHFKAEGSRSKNVKELAGLKKEIARVLTHMKQAK